MIPRAAITAWRSVAPWPHDAQIEQDLVISRALVEIFRNSIVSQSLAFRGGTALHKLHFDSPGRYSEDIDLVQLDSHPIGPLIDILRGILDPWLGTPKRKRGPGCVKLLYRFETTVRPIQRMRLKIEINTREHFSVLGLQHTPYEVRSPWCSGVIEITTYALEELLGTKLRALYQRKKGRDLFDLWWTCRQKSLDLDQVIGCFQAYLASNDQRVSRAELEANLAAKLDDRIFRADLHPLLAPGIRWNADVAAVQVSRDLIARLPGDPWKGIPGRP